MKDKLRIKINPIGIKKSQELIILSVIFLFTACTTNHDRTKRIDYSYEQHSNSSKVFYQSHHSKDILKFLGGSSNKLIEKIIKNGYFLAFADSNHHELGIRQKALDLIAQTKLKKIGIELPKNANLLSRNAYNKQFSYAKKLQPIMIDVLEEKHLELTQHPSYKYAYGAINHIKYQNILKSKKINQTELDCEFTKYRMIESDIKITKNIINQNLSTIIFGISHFTYRLNGQPAGIDNHLKKSGLKVKTIAIVAANQKEYRKLKTHFPDGDLVFANGLADIDYTIIIPAKTKAVDKLGNSYYFHNQQGRSVNISTSVTTPHRCSGLVPKILVEL